MRSLLKLVIFISIASGSPCYGQKLTKAEFDELKETWISKLVQIIALEDSIEMSPAFYTYREAYENYTDSFKGTISSRKELSQSLNGAKIVLIGDEHSNPLSQKNIIWTMEEMAVNTDDPLVLVIEWVNRKHQKHLDDYMHGFMSADKLREVTDFDQAWTFDWEDHLAILRKAKELNIKVMAAENRSYNDGKRPVPLRKRDSNVVAAISREYKKSINQRFLIAYGFYHLAGTDKNGHLKEKLTAAGLAPDIIIHPMSNGEYLRHLETELNTETVEVLKFSDSEFYLHQGDVQRAQASLTYYVLNKINSNCVELLSDAP